jgi:hypothetical protein
LVLGWKSNKNYIKLYFKGSIYLLEMKILILGYSSLRKRKIIPIFKKKFRKIDQIGLS